MFGFPRRTKPTPPAPQTHEHEILAELQGHLCPQTKAIAEELAAERALAVERDVATRAELARMATTLAQISGVVQRIEIRINEGVLDPRIDTAGAHHGGPA
jgi:hypothetical protein